MRALTTAPATRQTRRIDKIRSERIFREQRKHFVWVDIVPAIASIASIALLMKTGTHLIDWMVFGIMWVLSAGGIEIGYHRYFSHGSFACGRTVQMLLAIFGATAGQGPVVSWVANHRHHHRYSDSPGDNHSPHAPHSPSDGYTSAGKGLLHSHWLWKWSYALPNPSIYADRLLRDPFIRKIDRNYYSWVILGVIVPGIIAGLITRDWTTLFTSMALGGVLRLTLVQHCTYAINSICHAWGSRPYSTRDQSRNNVLLAIPSLGGSWHNNHHAFPMSACNQHRWWQIDPSYWIITTMKALRIARNVKTFKGRLI
jgi:stearoyl-CoA desaturase (delta-9 desaturase)